MQSATLSYAPTLPRMEETELVGTVRPLARLRAPLSGRGCALYQVRLTLLQRLLEGAAGGASREEAGTRFLLACRMGEVLVDCSEASMHLLRGTARRVRRGQDTGSDHRLDGLYRRLTRRGPPPTVRCREHRLERGDRVWVRGRLRSVPSAGGLPAGYRQPPQQLLLQAVELRVVQLEV